MAKKQETIKIPAIQLKEMGVRVVGLSPLITHRMSEKAKKILRDKTQNKKTGQREAKNPEAEFNGARYRVDDQGMPSEGTGADAVPAYTIKTAIVDAAKDIEGMSVAGTKRLLHVDLGRKYVPILNGSGTFGIDVEPEMDESIQRVGGRGPGTGTPDFRYRPLYRNWALEFTVTYNAALIGDDEVIALINYAGMHQGLCEHRPGKSGGQNGMFRVERILQ
jgi:hypothetical protein